jgi:hypothetical protein
VVKVITQLKHALQADYVVLVGVTPNDSPCRRQVAGSETTRTPSVVDFAYGRMETNTTVGINGLLFMSISTEGHMQVFTLGI